MMRKREKKHLAGLLLTGTLLGLLLMEEGRLLEADIARRVQKENETVPEVQEESDRGREEAPRKKQEKKGQTASSQEPLPAKGEEPEEGAEETAAVSLGEMPLMRVLLMTTDYESYEHPFVTVQADGQETTYTPETVGEQVIRLTAEEGTIGVPSICRAVGVPRYEGTVEIRRGEEGLLVINELPLEDYLCQVVPSEMPASYEKEALKAQAVCARTYAWRQYQDEKLAPYHAHVDDSVAFQVYGNVAGDAGTLQAVEETRGQILCQGGEPIQAYYFSTSSGATSTDEVWNPEEEAGYLQSVACAYDAAEPWSQWEVFFPTEVLNQRIRDHYGEIGKLMSLEILEKSTGGAVKALRILTDQESRVVHNEYDIRALFSPEGLSIKRKDESHSPGSSLLPSAYFRLDAVSEEGQMAGYTFLGGGYGHGVGMSQNGAHHMALEGKTWEEILHYFFKDVTVTKLHYGDG